MWGHILASAGTRLGAAGHAASTCSFPLVSKSFAVGLVHILCGQSTHGNGCHEVEEGPGTSTGMQQPGPPSAKLRLLPIDHSALLQEELPRLQTHPTHHRRTYAVPASRLSRATAFTGMLTRVGWSKMFAANPGGTVLPPESHEAIVAGLCRMRGAVLKLGQMLSIQDSKTVPPAVTAIFEKVRDQAFVMPERQLNKQLSAALGAEWKKKFVRFDPEPIAAASIGQVHLAELPLPHKDGQGKGDGNGDVEGARTLRVAVKVQYPGVAGSIDSDVANLKMLVTMQLLPAGLFVGNILRDLQQELKEECRYSIEAAKQRRYAALVAAEPALADALHVPRVFSELSSDTVLVSEFVEGVTIDQVAKLQGASQAFRDSLCAVMMRLTLTELFVWNFMQTDPNYSNFLVDVKRGVVNLIDFGAARDYPPAFIDDYLDVVYAAAVRDRAAVIEKSIALGFLTGQECAEMLDAHVESVFTLGLPFQPATMGRGFDFEQVNLPERLQRLVPTMLRLRLRPPPLQIYSLHRRISGTILICTRLGAKIDIASMFDEIRTRSLEQRAARAEQSNPPK